MIARPRLAALLLIGSIVVAACGGDTTTPAAADSLPAASTVPGTAPATAATPTTAATADEDCAMERNILTTAAEVYAERYGSFPSSEADLVEAQIIGFESAPYDIVAGTGEVVRVPGVGCDESGPDAAADPITVELVLDQLGPEGVEQVGGIECATELAEVAVAAEAFIAREGREPVSLDDLGDDLGEIELWTVDAERQTLVPAPGSPCVDLDAATEATAADVCETEAQTLTVAVEAYTAQYGAPPQSEDDLVGDFLRAPIERFDLDGVGAVVPAPGGDCDPAVTAMTTAP